MSMHRRVASVREDRAGSDAIPGLHFLENGVGTFIGIRCAVRDRIPMVGNVPNFAQQIEDYRNLFNLRRRKQPIKNAANFDNLYLIAALGSRGLTSAPLLGETLASLICNEPLPLSEDIVHCLNANRGWMRKLLKGTEVNPEKQR